MMVFFIYFDVIFRLLDKLFYCLQSIYNRTFFNRLITFYQTKPENVLRPIHRHITKREINNMLREFLNKECMNWNQNSNFLELSQILQINIFVRPFRDASKFIHYPIENSPYSMFIIYDDRDYYILKPFDMNYDWENQNFYGVFRRLKDVENDFFLEKCFKCNEQTNHLYCENFHSICLMCLHSAKCDECSSTDYKLTEYLATNMCQIINIGNRKQFEQIKSDDLFLTEEVPCFNYGNQCEPFSSYK